MASRLVTGSGAPLPFAVRRVYCVGRNYAEHRKEMGGSERDEPFFFSKPSDAVFQSAALVYPRGTKQLSYEAELVVIMNSPTEVYGYALGIDLTKRDVQAQSKKLGRPWESAKSFDNSGLIGSVVVREDIDESALDSSRLELLVNDQLRQSALVSDMIWSIGELIPKLEEQDFSVKQGDVIFTGTPAGVGELSVGDTCRVTLRNGEGDEIVPVLEFTVVQ